MAKFYLVQPSSDAEGVLTNATVVSASTLPQTLSGLAPATYRVASLAYAAGTYTTIAPLTVFLPDPATTPANRWFRYTDGTTETLVRTDGTKYIVVATGLDLATPWWLPAGATLHADFVNSRFYWNGAVKSVSDLTTVSAGVYRLLSYGAGITSEATVEIEYRYNDDKVAANEVLFSFAGSAALRFEIMVESGFGPGTLGSRTYLQWPGMTAAYFGTRRHWPNTASYTSGAGIRRTRMAIKTGEPIVAQGENWPLTATTVNLGTLSAPTSIGFGCRAYDANQPLTNGALRRATIWPKKMANATLEIMAKSGAAPRPLHLIGDSFLNQAVVTNELYKRIATRGKFVPITQDGVGSTSLAQQAVRLAQTSVTESGVVFDTSKYPGSSVIIADGGLDDTAAAAIAAISSVAETLGHDDWAWVQPAPNTPLGDPGRTDWDARVAEIAAFVGPNHYIPTLEAAYAESDGSPEDEAMVAQGYWPLSLRLSTTDFHPSALGSAFLARLIDEAAIARGWVA